MTEGNPRSTLGRAVSRQLKNMFCPIGNKEAMEALAKPEGVISAGTERPSRDEGKLEAGERIAVWFGRVAAILFLLFGLQALILTSLGKTLPDITEKMLTTSFGAVLGYYAGMNKNKA